MLTNLSVLFATGKKFVAGLKAHRDKQPGSRVTLIALLLFISVSMFVMGRWSSPTTPLLNQTIAGMKSEIMQQQGALEQLTSDQEMNINALAARLAELKAASTRIDALGARLVQLGQLDPNEFDFNRLPPVGGPEKVIRDGHSDVHDIITAIDLLAVNQDRQMIQLDALQLLLLDRNLESERTPAGWPVSSGWISSGFGERNDPFTGKRARHYGLDFAGIKGSGILSVASGVVIWSGDKQGYGRTIEIDHGNGYVTRYAHNEELMASVGSRVDFGEVIARMGTTGRASAAHVHFEVLFKGKAINPYQFVKQMR